MGESEGEIEGLLWEKSKYTHCTKYTLHFSKIISTVARSPLNNDRYMV